MTGSDRITKTPDLAYAISWFGFWSLRFFSILISLILIGQMSKSDKDLEIMIVRYQLGIAERKMKKPLRANRLPKG